MSEALIQRVKTIQERAGDNRQAFAARVGMTPDKLSKSLAGKRSFTSLELALIAEVDGTTIEWLLTGTEPITATQVAARTQSLSDIADADDVGRRYIDLYAETAQVLGDMQPRTLPGLPPEELIIGGRAIDQGAALAEWALTQVKPSPFPLGGKDLAALWETAFGVEIAAVPLHTGTDGLAWSNDDIRVILVARTSAWTRQRFTLAHELGHILAGDAHQAPIEESVQPSSSVSPREWRANAFAAEFLMPAQEVRQAVTGKLDEKETAALCWQFGVSPSAMTTRLKKLGLIPPDQATNLRLTTRWAADVGEHLREHLELSGEALNGWPPQNLALRTLSAWINGRLGVSWLASISEIDPNELLDWADRFTTPISGSQDTPAELMFTP